MLLCRIIQQSSENEINGIRLKGENILNDDGSQDDIISALKINQQLPKCVFNKYVQFRNTAQ